MDSNAIFLQKKIKLEPISAQRMFLPPPGVQGVQLPQELLAAVAAGAGHLPGQAAAAVLGHLVVRLELPVIAAVKCVKLIIATVGCLALWTMAIVASLHPRTTARRDGLAEAEVLVLSPRIDTKLQDVIAPPCWRHRDRVTVYVDIGDCCSQRLESVEKDRRWRLR